MAGQPPPLASDSQWLEPTWLLGHSGDFALDRVLPFVPERHRLVAAYTFRWAWFLLEVLVLLHFERAKDRCMAEFAWCLEAIVAAMRFAVLHVLPIAVSLLAASDDDGDGKWATISRRALLIDSAVYLGLLLPLLCVGHARRLLLSSRDLTALRVLKVVLTPLETLVVIYGTCGRGYDYNNNRSPTSGDLETDGDETDVGSVNDPDSAADVSKHPVRFSLLWLLWIVFILLGGVLVFQWARSTEPPCTVSCVAAMVFGMYAVGSLITACLALCAPDTLASAGYGLAQLSPDPGADGEGAAEHHRADGHVGAPRAKRLAAPRGNQPARPRLHWRQQGLVPEEVAPWTSSLLGSGPLLSSRGSGPPPCAGPRRSGSGPPVWTTGSLRSVGSP